MSMRGGGLRDGERSSHNGGSQGAAVAMDRGSAAGYGGEHSIDSTVQISRLSDSDTAICRSCRDLSHQPKPQEQKGPDGRECVVAATEQSRGT